MKRDAVPVPPSVFRLAGFPLGAGALIGRRPVLTRDLTPAYALFGRNPAPYAELDDLHDLAEPGLSIVVKRIRLSRPSQCPI
jgi:hypothetical protein